MISPAFSVIAPYYDLLMDDINYKEWIDYVEELFKFIKEHPKRVLDLACGTGNPSIILANRGYEVVGIDSSQEMLKVAKKKARTLNNLLFLRGDIRDFSYEAPPFDAAVCLFDSLNYILNERDLRSVFERVALHLRVGAPFLFDLNTLYSLKYYWGSQTKVKERDDIVSIWKTTFYEEEEISELLISLFVKEKEKIYRRFDELHRERAFSSETVEEMLHASGFDVVYQFEHLTLHVPRGTSLRVMFMAVKEK